MSDIRREDVIRGIVEFVKNRDIVENTDTFIIYENNKYPANIIRKYANYISTGIKLKLEDVSNPLDNILFFESLGFEVEYHTLKRESTTKQMIREMVNTSLDKYSLDLDEDEEEDEVDRLDFIFSEIEKQFED